MRLSGNHTEWLGNLSIGHANLSEWSREPVGPGNLSEWSREPVGMIPGTWRNGPGYLVVLGTWWCQEPVEMVS